MNVLDSNYERRKNKRDTGVLQLIRLLNNVLSLLDLLNFLN